MNGTRTPNRESRVTRSTSISPPKLSPVKTENISPVRCQSFDSKPPVGLEKLPLKNSIKHSSISTCIYKPYTSNKVQRFKKIVKPVRKKRIARKFFVGQEVLSRWKDGLFYLGTVLKVDEKSSKCFVRFEDNSEFWVLFKDLQKGQNSGEITCCQCQEGRSEVPNEIVLCDNCGMGYHQKCHNPKIQPDVLKPEVSWCCRLCVFASTVKKGGALKQGPNAQALQIMKQTLPYELQKLTWDAQHKNNIEHCYCYCGGPGDWYMKMLQCCRCRQWFHEACIQCLEQPLLYGDRFYLFVCSHCNCGPEYIKRLELKWVDIIHLTLFNLTLQNIKKYYDLDEVVMPFIDEHWSEFKVVEEFNVSNNRRQVILDSLHNHKSRFCWGREIRKRNTLWGLRLRVPPAAPTIQLPVEGQITDEVMNSLQMKGGKTKTFVPIQCLSPIPIRFKRKNMESCDSVYRRTKKARKLYSDATKVNEKQDKSSANQMYGGYNGKPPKKNKPGSLKKYILDKFIPHPVDFHGLNHPFKTVLECREELAKQTLKSKLINLYHSSLESDDTSASHSPASSIVSSPQSMENNFGPPILEPISKQPFRRGGRKRTSLPEDPPTLTCLRPEQLKNGLRKRHSMQNVVKTADIESVKSQEVNMDKLKFNVGAYFGAVDRLAKGEKFNVLARRITSEGTIQYLVEWKGAAL
ncbi:hypothetical protein ScPMuIL_010902 [Solemya velum]